jgi:hypothetical protein
MFLSDGSSDQGFNNQQKSCTFISFLIFFSLIYLPIQLVADSWAKPKICCTTSKTLGVANEEEVVVIIIGLVMKEAIRF